MEAIPQVLPWGVSGLRTLEEIEDAVVATGLKPGTPEFRHEVLRLQVDQCKQAKGLSECSLCKYAPSCTIRIQYWRAEALGADYIDEEQ